MSGNCENKFGNLAAMLGYLNQAGAEQKVREELERMEEAMR